MNLIKQNIDNIYVIGLFMFVIVIDIFIVFEQFLEVYNVQFLDDEGKFCFDNF